MPARLLGFLARSSFPPLSKHFAHYSVMSPPPYQFLYESVADEVENLEGYTTGGYYPANIGDTVHNDRYRIVHKLGYGAYSTVWLARDLRKDRLVSLKFLCADNALSDDEITALRLLNHPANPIVPIPDDTSEGHPGRQFILRLLNLFTVNSANGIHRCLVTEPVGPSIASVKYESPGNRLQANTARALSVQLATAVSYIHAHDIIHGDLHTGNLLLSIPGLSTWSDTEVYDRFGTPELLPLKRIDGEPPAPSGPRNIVCSPETPTLMQYCLAGTSVRIADFGEAIVRKGDHRPRHTPLSIAAPEVLLKDKEFGAPSDVWALGCTLFQVLSDHSLWESYLGDRDEVLQEIVSGLGKFPERWWRAWEERMAYFEEDGSLKGGDPPVGLRERVVGIVRGGDDAAKKEFEGEIDALMGVMEGVFKHEPGERITAAELAEKLPAAWKELVPAKKVDDEGWEYEYEYESEEGMSGKSHTVATCHMAGSDQV